jgi:hypothetical protein
MAWVGIQRSGLWVSALVAVSLAAIVVAGGMWLSAGPGGASRARAASHPALSSLPLAARGPVSAALGRDDPAYRVRAAAPGLSAVNGAQGLRVSFDRAGVLVRSGSSRLSLALAASGAGGRMHAVGAVAPRARGNRVVYAHGAVSEWYANGPLGLEQGFTVARALAGADGGGTLTLSLAVAGDLRPALSAGGQALSFHTAAGAAVLAYRGLVATDARGRTLPARLSLAGDRVLVGVQTRGASYPVRIDPFVQQAQLTASDGAAEDYLGYSVAVDGSTIVAGAPDHSVGGQPQQGAVYVFFAAPGGWTNGTQTAELTASDGNAYDRLGESVAISGSTIVAGTPDRTIGGSSLQGAVYVFSEPAGGWANATQIAELTASDGARVDSLGGSVAVDGSTIVAGASGHAVGANSSQGAVYVFSEPAGGWGNGTQSAELIASDGATYDALGGSVAVSGSTIAAGATGHGAATEKGAVYLFSKPAGGWANGTQTAELTASDAVVGDELGSSVALDGSTIAAGAINRHGGRGAVYVFSEPPGGWANGTQTAELTASDSAAGDGLGRSVAADGSMIVGGAPWHTVSGKTQQGAVYVFSEPAGGWRNATHTAVTGTPGAAYDSMGFGVAMSGQVIVAGAVSHWVGSNAAQGAAYVFGYAPQPIVTSVAPDNGPVAGGNAVTINGTNFQPGASVTFGSAPATGVTFISSTQLTAVAPADSPGSVNVRVSTQGGPSASANRNLYAYGPPMNISFPPTSGITGSRVTISGTAFAPGMVVQFGTLKSTGVKFLSGTQLTATVPNGDPGPSPITVSDGQGSATSTSQFTPTLSVTGFSPSRGAPGTVVTIYGLGFNGNSVAAFNGTPAATTFTSPTRLQATIPADATSGRITITNTTAPTGTVSSAAKFKVT